MNVSRTHGRIYFGEGAERWSVCDPGDIAGANPETLSRDWVYIASLCPDTKTAVEKLRLIRWAIRNVEIGETVFKPSRKADHTP